MISKLKLKWSRFMDWLGSLPPPEGYGSLPPIKQKIEPPKMKPPLQDRSDLEAERDNLKATNKELEKDLWSMTQKRADAQTEVIELKQENAELEKLETYQRDLANRADHKRVLAEAQRDEAVGKLERLEDAVQHWASCNVPLTTSPKQDSARRLKACCHCGSCGWVDRNEECPYCNPMGLYGDRRGPGYEPQGDSAGREGGSANEVN